LGLAALVRMAMRKATTRPLANEIRRGRSGLSV
jgi:hypothetical protein